MFSLRGSILPLVNTGCFGLLRWTIHRHTAPRGTDHGDRFAGSQLYTASGSSGIPNHTSRPSRRPAADKVSRLKVRDRSSGRGTKQRTLQSHSEASPTKRVSGVPEHCFCSGGLWAGNVRRSRCFFRLRLLGLRRQGLRDRPHRHRLVPIAGGPIRFAERRAAGGNSVHGSLDPLAGSGAWRKQAGLTMPCRTCPPARPALDCCRSPVQKVLEAPAAGLLGRSDHHRRMSRAAVRLACRRPAPSRPARNDEHKHHRPVWLHAIRSQSPRSQQSQQDAKI